MNKVVLITGGYGYLGGRVARQCAEAGYFVRLGTSRKGLVAPSWLPDAQTARIDVVTGDGLDEACKGTSAVVHLAALNEIDSALDPQLALRVNGTGALNTLQAAQRNGVERFVYMSTAHVYCSPLAGTITETTLARPAHPYAITHRVAEDFVLAAHDAGRIKGAVLRLSNGFGAPAHTGVNRWTLLVNDLCRQAIESSKLVLRSSGLQLRDFITLHDTARAVLHFLKLPAADFGDGLFNLGARMPMSVIDMSRIIASRCKAVLGAAPQIIRPEPKADEKILPLDYRIDKLLSTGFTLEGDINEEIDATLKVCSEAFGKRGGK